MSDQSAPVCALDVPLAYPDIQGLNGPEALAAFFSRLGYDINARTEQSPSNLGISAESILRHIRRVELLADSGGEFQVYLFELNSLTVASTRALARAFRERAGDYLLVLTADYERLDFVLLERFVPGDGEALSLFALPRSAVRPRILSVDRKKPDPVHLRVLRRFTWTELDPLAQHDKLLSAYSIAEWSEQHFNNRALFSDYYLRWRFGGTAGAPPAWDEDPRGPYVRLRELYQGAVSRLGGKPNETMRADLLTPTLHLMGFEARGGRPPRERGTEPDYRLFSPEAGTSPIALLLSYPWGRFLDGRDDMRDVERPEENPGAAVVSLLESGEAPWVVVTNGKLWRLYSARAHSRATNYYEIDVEELLSETGPYAGDFAEAFGYFWLIFRAASFVPHRVVREGTEQHQSFLDLLLIESAEYAKELGDRLKERVFEEVFPYLAEGFVADIRRRDGEAAELSDAVLDDVFRGTLTFLYRLLFLLYAETRGLLPVRETREYFDASLDRVKKEVAEAAGPIVDEVPGRLNAAYADDEFGLYERLVRLFTAVDQGAEPLNLPPYNGGLFRSQPIQDSDATEDKNARFLSHTRVPDRHLAIALDRLARDPDPKRHDLVFLDYKSLGVRQLGSIYEGLLEFKVRLATEPMAVVAGKETEEVIPLREAEAQKRRILSVGGKKSGGARIIQPRRAYLTNDKHERKATGSYYTPDHIVEYIVENAVGPVLDAKLETMRPLLRDAELERRAFHARLRGFEKAGVRPEPAAKADLIGQELLIQLFDFRVLDPAMGSGHFLVEAVDFITDRMLHFLNGFAWNPVFVELARMRKEILDEMDERGVTIDPSKLTDVHLLKRHVLKRCIYGVDLNPMAVELAKVSLWLDSFTLGAPLSFLDHHLRTGNSLLGVTIGEVREALARGEQAELLDGRFTGLLQAVESMRHVGELSDVTGEQVSESRTEYLRATDILQPLKRVLDVYASRWFGNPDEGRGQRVDSRVLLLIRSPQADAFFSARTDAEVQEALLQLGRNTQIGGRTLRGDREVARTAYDAARERRFFHWELEFPEVFFGPRPGTTQAIERLEGAGFDAVIGNPPYDVLAGEELGHDVTNEIAFFKAHAVYAPAVRGKNNLYKLFICRAITLRSQEGNCSFIVPMPLLGDDQAAGVRQMLLRETGLRAIEAFPQKDDPKNRVFEEAKLSTTIFVVSGSYDNATFVVRTHPGKLIEETTSTSLRVRPEQVVRFDPENSPIFSCTQHDWELAAAITSTAHVRRFRDYVTAYQGEVNETTDGKKGFVSYDPGDGPEILRGAHITLYAIREASQGEAIYLRLKQYIEGKKRSERAKHHLQNRMGWQESSPQNNFRRLIGTRIPQGRFCNHLVNYIPEQESQLSLDLVLALFNCAVSEWFFRLSSTNAHVSQYQVYMLPAPRLGDDDGELNWEDLLEGQRWADLAEALKSVCPRSGLMPLGVANALEALCREIQDIESERTLKSRSERSSLATKSQTLQAIIDEVIFHCYGLSTEDASYIHARLQAML